jgi:DNA-binding MarR family transcriptional regulator
LASVHKLTREEQTALHMYMSFMEAFRAIRPNIQNMPMGDAYGFLVVALEGGLGITEYAERAGITQSGMTRTLSALGEGGRYGAAGFGLVQQVIDGKDLRKRQTFLTAKGKALIREITRLTRSDHQSATTPDARSRDLKMIVEKSPRDLPRNQWFLRLIAAARKLDSDDIKLAVRQIEVLIGHRQSKKPGSSSK